MGIRLNEDKEIVATIREGLKAKGGYCPCRLQRTEENKCICKEFREQMADPNFEGYCHCRRKGSCSRQTDGNDRKRDLCTGQDSKHCSKGIRFYERDGFSRITQKIPHAGGL